MASSYRRRSFKIYGTFMIFIIVLSYPMFTLVLFSTRETVRSDLNYDHKKNFSCLHRKLLSSKDNLDSGEYPSGVFSKEELKHYVALHIIGICYMFLALSIVCDEFFVPALHVITEILAISDDVAGATFMAAGGSAPELFTSILGVFVAKSNIGFGTIVGSAVFNVLFVIGMCVIFSKTVLHLTWWPLTRDSFFYSLSLALLISFFRDSKIAWWESATLFAVYLVYVIFMYFNERIEAKVKQLIAVMRRNGTKISPQSGTGNHYQNCTLQLVIHTLDPISEATAENKLHRFKEILQTEVLKDSGKDSFMKKKYRQGKEGGKPSEDIDASLRKKGFVNKYLGEDKSKKETTDTRKLSTEKSDLQNSSGRGNQYSYETSRSNSECSIFSHDIQDEASSNRNNRTNSMASFQSNNPKQGSVTMETPKTERTVRFSGRVSKMSCVSHHGMSRVCLREAAAEKQGTIDDGDEEPLSLKFPKKPLLRIYYIIKFPIVILLFFTLPDVRRPSMKKLFPLTFIGSIMWIGGFSYLMVWWASITGATLGIPAEVMGLTFLAAGTSIPDLITSVLVAKEGLGDMAVSSSIGSNIFDVTVGLPVPWFIWSAVYSFTPLVVDSTGLFCSTILLFLMLVAVIASIAIFKWRMTKYLAGAMFTLYAVFLTIALLIEFNVVSCFL